MNNNLTTETPLTLQRPPFKSRKIEGGVEVSIALPGVARNDLSLNIEERILSVKGQRKAASDFTPKDDEALTYELRVRLHEDLDTGAIDAAYQHGVLTLKLNKRQELAPRKIDILAN